MTGSAVHSEVEVDDDASDDDIDNAVYDQMAQYCDYGWEEVES
jgi:Tfp pilus assembly PilM family ATPase